jgi:hypothetical protein
VILPKSNEGQKPPIRPKTSLPLSLAPISDGCPHRSIGMPQQRYVPHAIVWQGDNPYQAWPPHLAQSYPSLNEHTVGYGPVWKNGIPEHLLREGQGSAHCAWIAVEAQPPTSSPQSPSNATTVTVRVRPSSQLVCDMMTISVNAGYYYFLAVSVL